MKSVDQQNRFATATWVLPPGVTAEVIEVAKGDPEVVRRPGRVDVFIGKPIDAREYGEQRLPDLIERTRSAIEAELKSD